MLVNVSISYRVRLHSYAGHAIVYSGKFKTSASDVVNFHIGIKNLDVELNCRSEMELGQNF